MNEQESYLPTIKIRIVYSDPPDLIELKTSVESGDWSGTATAYASPTELINDAKALAAWSRNPVNEFRIEAGADTGIGWLVLKFIPIDMIGHLQCRITLATSDSSHRHDEESWRLSLSMRTEPALVERFARQLVSLSAETEEEAVLEGLAV
jgi:hypothetical protein